MEDGEDIERPKKERDELLQKDIEASKWVVELLSVAEEDRERKLVVEAKLVAAEVWVCQDAVTLKHVRKKQDKLR
jgi:hypothetical protein